jgi:hypothetical protein
LLKQKYEIKDFALESIKGTIKKFNKHYKKAFEYDFSLTIKILIDHHPSFIMMLWR